MKAWWCRRHRIRNLRPDKAEGRAWRRCPFLFIRVNRQFLRASWKKILFLRPRRPWLRGFLIWNICTVKPSVDPHFIAGRHQDGFQRAAGGAFAIGARDGKNERRRFNDIHLPGDLADARQPKVDGFTVQMFQIRKPRSQGRRGLRRRADGYR